MKYTIEDVYKLKPELPDIAVYEDEAVLKGLNVEVEHADITGGDLITTGKIVLAHLKEAADYYDKLAEVEKTNAKQKPTVYYARHIEKGIVGYDDSNLFIDNGALGKMAKSMLGCPVYVYHQNVDLDTIENADGYITDCFYNEKDGWWWCKFVVTTDEAHEKISLGWGVSNAYVPTSLSDGGEWHNIKYDKQIDNGYYTHLAIVPDPRYEGVMIYSVEDFKAYNRELEIISDELVNNKNGGLKIMFFRKKQVKEDVEIKNATDLTDVMLEIDGQEIAVLDMIEAVKNAKNEKEEEKKEEKINEETEIEVDGKKMTVGELVKEYKAACAKKNADDEEKKEEKEEEKKNEVEVEIEEKKEEKKNNKHFEELKNADKAVEKNVVVETSINKEQRGQSRYGSNK